MKIEDLQPDANFDELKARILSRQGPKRVKARGRWASVWEFLLIDETGSTVLSLWGHKKGEEFKVGDVVLIVNGWCKSYMGRKQVSLGRDGKIYHEEEDPNLPRSLPDA